MLANGKTIQVPGFIKVRFLRDGAASPSTALEWYTITSLRLSESHKWDSHYRWHSAFVLWTILIVSDRCAMQAGDRIVVNTSEDAYVERAAQ